jgi:endonuclease/exonuclease/phosphatase family metal-dependent hydrolase
MKRLFVLYPLVLSLFLSACGGDVPSKLSDDPRSFSLVTYNVQSRPVLDLGKAIANLPIIGAKSNEYQIIGFQECFSVCSLLLNAAKHLSRYYFDSKQHWWNIANSGLVSLGQFPLIEHQQMFYSAKGEIADTVASKGIILMRYEVEGKTLDVYNTHMQAGNSPQAQTARTAQAKELIQFISEHSPPEHAVIVHGDFNMGPARPGKRWEDYRPNHYSSTEDMQVRTAVFSDMQTILQLSDVSDTINGPALDHIDRILFRNGTEFMIHPVAWADKSEEFHDKSGKDLSDSVPVYARFAY